MSSRILLAVTLAATALAGCQGTDSRPDDTPERCESQCVDREYGLGLDLGNWTAFEGEFLPSPLAERIAQALATQQERACGIDGAPSDRIQFSAMHRLRRQVRSCGFGVQGADGFRHVTEEEFTTAYAEALASYWRTDRLLNETRAGSLEAVHVLGLLGELHGWSWAILKDLPSEWQDWKADPGNETKKFLGYEAVSNSLITRGKEDAIALAVEVVARANTSGGHCVLLDADARLENLRALRAEYVEAADAARDTDYVTRFARERMDNFELPLVDEAIWSGRPENVYWVTTWLTLTVEYWIAYPTATPLPIPNEALYLVSQHRERTASLETDYTLETMVYGITEQIQDQAMTGSNRWVINPNNAVRVSVLDSLQAHPEWWECPPGP